MEGQVCALRPHPKLLIQTRQQVRGRNLKRRVTLIFG